MKIKNISKFVILFLAFHGFIACAQQQSKPASVQNINVQELAKIISNNADVQLIDVRTPGEYVGGHIGDARLLDYNSGEFEQQYSSLDKSKPVIIYCAAGGRSSNAAKFLIKNGYTDVTNVEGGFNDWSAANLPVTK